MIQQAVERLYKQSARLNLYVAAGGCKAGRIRDGLDEISLQLRRVYEILQENENSGNE